MLLSDCGVQAIVKILKTNRLCYIESLVNSINPYPAGPDDINVSNFDEMNEIDCSSLANPNPVSCMLNHEMMNLLAWTVSSIKSLTFKCKFTFCFTNEWIKTSVSKYFILLLVRILGVINETSDINIQGN